MATWRGRREKIRVNWVSDKEDRETCFIKKRCATYLLRLIQNKALLEEPDLEFGLWVLGPQAGFLARKLAANLQGEDKRHAVANLRRDSNLPEVLLTAFWIS